METQTKGKKRGRKPGQKSWTAVRLGDILKYLDREAVVKVDNAWLRNFEQVFYVKFEGSVIEQSVDAAAMSVYETRKESEADIAAPDIEESNIEHVDLNELAEEIA